MLCMVECTLSAKCMGWPYYYAGHWSGHPDRYPRLTPDHHCCRHMLTHRHQNWKLQHRYHDLFADESIVNLLNCNGRVRLFHGIVERLVDCCIHKTGGILGHDDRSGRMTSPDPLTKNYGPSCFSNPGDPSFLGVLIFTIDPKAVWNIIQSVVIENIVQSPDSI